MSVQLTIDVTFDRLPALRGAMRAQAARAVRKAAEDIRGQAAAAAPVDTGALRNSIQDTATGDVSAEVSVGVEYGAYVEYGTRFQSAQPYLNPAVDLVRPSFEAAMAQVVKV